MQKYWMAPRARAREAASVAGYRAACPDSLDKCIDYQHAQADSLCMESANQQQATAAPKKVPGRPFVKGNDPRRDNSGRKRVTDADRKLQAMTRAQVLEALEQMVGPALQRLEAIVKKGEDDATAAKAIFTLLDRVIGPVPSASYIAAQIAQTNGNPNGVACVTHTEEEVAAKMLAYLHARGLEGAIAPAIEHEG